MTFRLLSLIALGLVSCGGATAADPKLPADVAACNRIVDSASGAEHPERVLAGAIRDRPASVDAGCPALLLTPLARRCEQLGQGAPLVACGDLLLDAARSVDLSEGDRLNTIWNTMTRVAADHANNGRLAREAGVWSTLEEMVASSAPVHRGWYEPILRSRRADLYRREGKFEEAEKIYEDLVRDAERRKPADLADLTMSLFGLARTYESAGRLDRAVVVVDRALAEIERVDGRDSFALVHGLEQKGRLLVGMGDAAAAAEIQRRVAEIERAEANEEQ